MRSCLLSAATSWSSSAADSPGLAASRARRTRVTRCSRVPTDPARSAALNRDGASSGNTSDSCKRTASGKNQPRDAVDAEQHERRRSAHADPPRRRTATTSPSDEERPYLRPERTQSNHREAACKRGRGTSSARPGRAAPAPRGRAGFARGRCHKADIGTQVRALKIRPARPDRGHGRVRATFLCPPPGRARTPCLPQEAASAPYSAR